MVQMAPNVLQGDPRRFMCFPAFSHSLGFLVLRVALVGIITVLGFISIVIPSSNVYALSAVG